MFFHSVLAVVASAAVFTNEGSQVVVPSDVILHVALCSKAKSTVSGTLERAQIIVNKHVGLQILLLRKRLITLEALERLRPIM